PALPCFRCRIPPERLRRLLFRSFTAHFLVPEHAWTGESAPICWPREATRRMTREVLAERMRLARYVAGHGWRRFVIKLTANPRFRWRVGLSVPERLLIAPQDLRTGDPTLASEFYSGRFVFAGKVVATDGRSPFEMPPPSREWEREL